MKKKLSKDFWNDSVIEWEISSYATDRDAKRTLGLIDKVASHFRAHIVARRRICLEKVQDFVQGRVIVDIGCATGSVAFSLIEMGAKRVYGLDISENAIRECQRKTKQKNLNDEKIRFIQYAAGDSLSLEEVDLAVGIGILEHVHPEDFSNFMRHIRPSCVFFSFHEKMFSIKNLIHLGYRMIRPLPFYKMYRPQEIKELFKDIGYPDTHIFREDANSFIYQLKE